LTNPLEGLDSRTLFDAAADAMLLTDADGNILLTNRALRQMLGYSDDDGIIGKAVEFLIPERHRARHRQHRKHYSAKPTQRAMGNGNNLVVMTSDGRELPVDIGLSPINDHGNHLVLATFHFPDRHQQDKKALWESEERLRLAKSAAGLGVFDFDLLKQTALCDERIRELWGFAEDESISYGNLTDGLHPQDLLIRNAALQRAMNPDGNGEYQVEYRVINKNDKSEHWLSITGKVFFSNGVAIRMVGVVRDISSQKKLERDLHRQQTEMERLLKRQMAAQTAAAIAHEINQPLAAISAYSEVALHALSSGQTDTTQLTHALNGCFAQAQRAGSSLHELLTFLQRSDIEMEIISFNSLWQELQMSLKQDDLHDFDLKAELAEQLPAFSGNRTQILKVLLNLLFNAAEAMRDAGISPATVTISTALTKDRKHIRISVRDNGPGIPAEIARRLFEPFFSTKPNGIGMGLKLSRAMIESMGGKLWLDETARNRTTFHFTLPRAP
jgi:two-component system sensor kinase FixL